MINLSNRKQGPRPKLYSTSPLTLLLCLPIKIKKVRGTKRTPRRTGQSTRLGTRGTVATTVIKVAVVVVMAIKVPRPGKGGKDSAYTSSP